MTVAEAIQHPTATVIILAEITARKWLRAWVPDDTYLNVWVLQHSFEDFNGKTNRLFFTQLTFDDNELTEMPDHSDLNGTPGTWAQDETYLYVHMPVSVAPFGFTLMATCKFWLSNFPKTLNSIAWDPRLGSAPAISQRIEAVFGDVSQIGGGEMSLINADGYFSQLTDLIWDAGAVTLKLGVDLPPDRIMAWADYETLATWSIESWQDDGDAFQLRLLEPKARVKAKLPLDTFDRDTYPNIDDDNVGKPIPIAYGANFGVAPVVINPGTKTFKVAGHEIRGFDAVRLKKSRAELITRTTSTLDWLELSGTTKRFYIADETVKSVTFKGTVLTEVNDVDDVTSTASRWAYVENYVYVNPPSASDWSAGDVVIESEQTSPAMVSTNFASVDAANGEFTLGDDWAVGTEVAVDFRGKVSAGVYLENAIDIIADLLAIAGETNINAATFAEARARLKIGTDEENSDVHILRPSLYLTEPQDFVDIVGDICHLARAYMFSDATGQYSVGVFEPSQGESLAKIDDTENFSLERTFRTEDLITKIVVKYQNRPVDGFAQTEVVESTELLYIHGQPAAVSLFDDDEALVLPTAYERDAEYWAQTMICLLGKPLAKHQLVVPWKFLQLLPGDQVRIDSTAFQISGVFEVLEKRIDLSSKHVTLIVGNLRAFEDAPGFWVADADVLPSRFASLTGYGAGSLVWNVLWDDTIKQWARQNVGYWTDENGFAASADPDSFMTSVWD